MKDLFPIFLGVVLGLIIIYAVAGDDGFYRLKQASPSRYVIYCESQR